ncbi:MAG: beta-lactamase family protein [Rhizobiaceae bacterium]|nr:beta-lactamase family protein [Rhizobiaceae bacterium]
MQFFFIALISVGILAAVYYWIKLRLARAIDSGDLQAELAKEATKLFKHDLARDLVIFAIKDGIVLEHYQSKDVASPNVSADSIYEIGSISKVFTSSLLSILVAENKLKLDDDLDTLIGDRFVLADHIKPITLQQLATHTSGIPRVPKVMLNKLEVMDNPYSTFTVDDIAEYLKAAKQYGKLGKFEYSNLGMGLLGHIMEWKTGQTLDALMKKHIFDPLDMHATGFSVSDENLPLFVDAHDPKGKPTPHWDFPILGGAGGIRSTPSDMIKFLKANLDGNTAISEHLVSTHPDPKSKKEGLGWMGPTIVERFLGNKNLIWHNGLVGGHASYISFEKTNNTGVLVLSNKAMDLHVVGSKLSRALRIHSIKH